MSSEKTTEAAPAQPIITPLRVKYLRTGAKATIITVKPTSGWLNHTLRAEFGGGCGFTFHCGELFNLFLVDVDES